MRNLFKLATSIILIISLLTIPVLVMGEPSPSEMYFYEDFESPGFNLETMGWNPEVGVPGGSEISIKDDSQVGKYLYVKRGEGGGTPWTNVTKQLNQIVSGKIAVEFKFRTTATHHPNNFRTVNFRNSSNSNLFGVSIQDANQKFRVVGPGGPSLEIPAQTNKWYTVRFEANTVTGMGNVYLDGVLKSEQFNLQGGAGSHIDNIHITLNAATYGDIHVDDIKIYSLDSSVPTIAPTSTPIPTPVPTIAESSQEETPGNSSDSESISESSEESSSNESSDENSQTPSVSSSEATSESPSDSSEPDEPEENRNILLWIIPAIILILIAGAVWFVMKREKK